MDSSIVCPNCKSPNPASNLFCQFCGARLGEATQQAPKAVSTPSAAAPKTPQQPTQQPPAYQAAAPVAYPPPSYAQYQPQPAYVPPSLKRLGVKVDEFTEVFASLGGRAEEVTDEFSKSMSEKGLPGVTMSQSSFTSGRTQRTYQVASHSCGSTMVAGINPAGKDLEVSWMLYTHKVPNWITLGIIAGVSLVVTLATAFTGGYGITIFSFGTWYMNIVLTLIASILVTGVLGKILADDVLHFFVHDLDDMAWEDTTVMQTVIHDALMKAVEKVQATPAKKVAAEATATRTRKGK
jgi:hypothetical protein